MIKKRIKKMIASDYQNILRTHESKIFYFIKRMYYKFYLLKLWDKLFYTALVPMMLILLYWMFIIISEYNNQEKILDQMQNRGVNINYIK